MPFMELIDSGIKQVQESVSFTVTLIPINNQQLVEGNDLRGSAALVSGPIRDTT